MYQVKSVTDLSEAFRLMGTYLEQGEAPNPFMRPSWLGAWVDHCAPRGNPEVLFVYDEEGHLVGYAPLWRTKSWLGVSHYSLMGDGTANLLDIVCRGKINEMLSALGRHFEGIGEPAILRLYDIDRNSELAKQLLLEDDVESVYLYDCPFVEMPEGFDPFFRQRLDSKRRREILRFETRLKELGSIQVATITDEQALRKWGGRLDELFLLHSERFQRVVNTSGFSDPGRRRFYSDLLARTAADHTLFLSVFLLDDQVVSFVLGFRFGGRIVDCIPAFAPALSPFSLGHLHLYHLLRELPDIGVTVFDFSKGNGIYKSKWATGSSGNVAFWRAYNLRPGDNIGYLLLLYREHILSYFRSRGTTGTVKRILGKLNGYRPKAKGGPEAETYISLGDVSAGPLRYRTIARLRPEIRDKVLQAVARGAHPHSEHGVIRLMWDDGRVDAISE